MVGADPCPIKYASASVGQWSSFTKCEIFRGQRRLAPEIWASEKVDFEWVEKRSHFSVCGPKFTKFGRHIREWSQYADPFSGRRYLVPIWRNLQWSPKWRSWKLRFSPPKFLGRRTPKIRCRYFRPQYGHMKSESLSQFPQQIPTI